MKEEEFDKKEFKFCRQELLSHKHKGDGRSIPKLMKNNSENFFKIGEMNILEVQGNLQ